MAGRWVNAVVEFTIALEVSPDASDQEKVDAADAAFEKYFKDVAAEYVAVARHETVEDGEPVEVDPAVRLDALRKGLQGEVEHYRALAQNLASPDLVEVAENIADRLQALLDSSGGK